MTALTVPVRKDALVRWLRPRHADLVAVEVGQRHRLLGGVGSPLVERVEVSAVGPRGQRDHLDVVAKRASSAEVIALRENANVPAAKAFPEPIDAGVDQSGPWVVTPYYPGSALPADGAIPEGVFESLAGLHHRWLGTASSLPDDLRRVDETFCREALTAFAPAGIREAQRKDPHPVHDRALDHLHHWSHDERIYAGPDLLPATLLHGDVYGDVYGPNVVVAPENGVPPRLIDWGSARVGPLMLDVALSTDASAPDFSAYLRAWENVAGCPLDPWQAAAGHAWATAFELCDVRRRRRREVRPAAG